MAIISRDARVQIETALAERYVIERELGAGGMATVYLAHDRRHERPVAIKVLRGAQGAPLDAERFHREIKLLARLRHPFVLPLHDSGDAAGALYFVMPFIDGESLRGRLEREGALPLGDALEIVRQVADALHYAHGEGVVHRDVKPENILLSRYGHALLADFGIARGGGPAGGLTEVGVAIGTAAYMSPEQALGESGALDGRSDVYALGCVLFEMLAGRPPFVGPTTLAVVAKHIGARPPSLATLRPDVPPSVERAVARALAKAPEGRFATIAAFARALAGSDDVPPVAPSRASSARLSIVVLPVTNRSADTNDGFFGDGLTEELINALAKVEGLRVVSRTSAFAFREGRASVREIGERLGVGFVLAGSVRRSGTRLRMTAQLARVEDDSTLWSETYERQTEDVFAVQDDIARRIVETITGALQLGHLRGMVTARQPRTLEVYDLYLLGRHYWSLRTETGMRRALELFEQAIALDPAYAPAHSGVADANALLASWQFAAPADMYPRAVAAALRALELDGSSADACASLGFVKLNWEWRWDDAERWFRRAIALNPSHETAHRWLSAFLSGIGRYDEGLPIALRAIELDPISILPYMNLGIVHLTGGRYAEALRAFDRVTAMNPAFPRGHTFRAAALAALGHHGDAITAAALGAEHGHQEGMLRLPLGLCLALAGRTREAREIFQQVRDVGLPPLYSAMAYATLGEESAMFEALAEGIVERADWMYSLGTQPWFRDYHADPRFLELLGRLQQPAAT